MIHGEMASHQNEGGGMGERVGEVGRGEEREQKHRGRIIKIEPGERVEKKHMVNS